MEKPTLKQWLNDDLEVNADLNEIKKRVEFLTEQAYASHINHIDAYNTMKVFGERQKTMLESISRLTEVLNSTIEHIGDNG